MFRYFLLPARAFEAVRFFCFDAFDFLAIRPAPLQRLQGRSASGSLPVPRHLVHLVVGPAIGITPLPLHAEHVSRVWRCLPEPLQYRQGTVGVSTSTDL